MHRRQRRYRLGYGGLVLWETGEVPVSMTGRTQATNPVTNSIYQQLGGRF